GDRGSEPDPARLGKLLPYRQRHRQVHSGRPVRGVAAQTASDQEAGPEPACRGGRSVDRGLVQRAGPLPAPWDHSLPKGCVTRVKKTNGKPCAGKPHARIERGMGKRASNGTAPLTTNGSLGDDDRTAARRPGARGRRGEGHRAG